jgi:hypothetical protein
MLFRILILAGLAAPHAVYLAWLTTGFNNINAILNNRLATGFFLEMVAATFLLSLFFRANPLGKVSVGWFVLLSLIGGVGPAIPMFYWLNKRGRIFRRKVRLTRTSVANAQKEKLATMKQQPSLILRSQSV